MSFVCQFERSAKPLFLFLQMEQLKKICVPLLKKMCQQYMQVLNRFQIKTDIN